MENGPFICVICPISTSIQFDELPESYVQFPMATNDQRLSLKQHQTFNTTKFHEHAIIKIPKLTRINKKRCFLAPNLDTTWHKSLDCGRCISKMYELKAPLTLGALEFYLGPGYTEWELKEDTWRNSWKTWDFGMWKNTTPWCMSFFYCIFWLSQALVLGVLGVLGGLETAVTSDQQKWPEVKSGPPSSSCSRPRKMGPWKAIFSCPMSAMSHLFAH